VTPRHRRGDRVILIGSGPRAHVEKVAACRTCREQAEHPGNDLARDIWWRRHVEESDV